MRRAQKGRAAKAEADGLHLNGVYLREPWGYLGMTVRIYRAKKDGSLYAMRDARGVIATAQEMDALEDLAKKERWVVTYRHVDAAGKESWVSVPE